MSAQHTPGCTCTARCGDCPGIRAGTNAACSAFIAAQTERLLHNAAPEMLETLREAQLVLAEKLRRLNADPEASPTYRRIGAAIAKATGSGA